MEVCMTYYRLRDKKTDEIVLITMSYRTAKRLAKKFQLVMAIKTIKPINYRKAG